ncbi:recombinase family protein, partial [Zavarzinella formosa]|uniref:recombinase family protein n=1 Tax=Zavarzinella formosa TaxID=360055 RepID=UPI0006987900
HRSLDQQLLNVLEEARRLDTFIPWTQVFADAAITGTIAARRGYQMAKTAVAGPGGIARILFIDEIGRASRDVIESLHLGRQIEQAGNRMIGASDRFDSNEPDAKLKLFIYAFLHDMFVDQLRKKVKRGMRDAFSRGKNIGKPAVGYKLIPVTDNHGRPIHDSEGRIARERVIDQEAAGHVREACESYADGGKSRGHIGRLFNRREVGGIRTWDAGSIRQLLERATYRGVEFYEMTHRVTDPVTGKVKIKKRPESEWLRREVPHLRIISDELGERVDARLAKSRAAYARNKGANRTSRTELHHKTLVRPVCGVCHKPMWLGRSGRYASYVCLDGRDGKNGCTSKAYKAARIIDDAVLDHLRDAVFTQEFVAEVTVGANRFLAEQPSVVSADPKPLDAAIRKKEAAIRVITAKLDEADGATDLGAIFEKVSQMENELKELKARRLALADKATTTVPPPMTLEAVTALMGDLRELLNDDPQAAAPVLAKLTGPVVVTQEPVEGSKRPVWMAMFTLDAVAVMLVLAKKRHCPTTGAWEFLNTRGWTLPNQQEAGLSPVPKYEQIADEAVKMRDAGSGLQTIARVLETTWWTVRDALAFGDIGERPKTKTQKKPTCRRGPHKYRAIAAEVVRLREEEQMSFDRIAERLEASQGTVTRAYDHLRPAAVRNAAATGDIPSRGKYRHLSPDQLAEIEKLLREGRSDLSVAEAVGCGKSSVRRERLRLGLGKEPKSKNN